MIITLWRAMPLPLSAKEFLEILMLGIWWIIVAYVTLVGYFNRTTVSVDPDGSITTTYGPLVVFRRPFKTISKIKKIYYLVYMRGSIRRYVHRYEIWAENIYGRNIVLFKKIDTESDVITVIEKLRQQLADNGSQVIEMDQPMRIN